MVKLVLGLTWCISCLFFVPGCSSSRQLKISNPSIAELLSAASEFRREVFGFTPLPTDPSQEVTVHRGNVWDNLFGKNVTILEFRGRTVKFVGVAPSATGTGYRWVSEREIFFPNFTSRMEGSKQSGGESVELIYESVMVFGKKTNELCVFYDGDDPILAGRGEGGESLQLSDVSKKLRLWNNWIPPERSSPKAARNEASVVLDGM